MNAATLMLRDLHIFQQEFAFLPSPEVFSRNFSQTIFQSRLIRKLWYSLFGRVVELVLVGAREALLDAAVRPEPLHAGQQLLREGLRVLHARHHVHHHLGVALQFKEGGKLRNGLPDGWQKWGVAGCHNIIKYESVMHCQGAWQIPPALWLILGGTSKIEKVALPRQPHLLPIPITCQLLIRL